MYDRGAARIGRRPGTFDHRSCDPSRNGTGITARPTREKIDTFIRHMLQTSQYEDPMNELIIVHYYIDQVLAVGLLDHDHPRVVWDSRCEKEAVDLASIK
jgi:hypothetical protein